MKKILFAALAALAITSCSQNEEIEAPAKKAEIKFNTAVSKNSRAASITTSTFENFTAYAYSHTGVFASATKLNLLIPETNFSTKDGGTTWTAGSTKFYWPDTDNVSFFAFSPNTTGQITYTDANVSGVAPTLNYTVKEAVKDQEDLIVAELMNKTRSQSATGTEAVALNFKHALTKVGFKIKAESAGVKYTLEKISIRAKDSGVYTYNATTTAETILGSWDTSKATEATYNIAPGSALTLTGKDVPTEDETLYTADYTAMLIPQALADVKLDIYYKAETTDGIELRNKLTNPETIAFTTGNWAAGQNLIYTLTLKVEEISVKGSISDTWDSTPGDDITTH